MLRLGCLYRLHDKDLLTSKYVRSRVMWRPNATLSDDANHTRCPL